MVKDDRACFESIYLTQIVRSVNALRATFLKHFFLAKIFLFIYRHFIRVLNNDRTLGVIYSAAKLIVILTSNRFFFASILIMT
jgi:uncharacterized membrane protein required for colicin V production